MDASFRPPPGGDGSFESRTGPNGTLEDVDRTLMRAPSAGSSPPGLSPDDQIDSAPQAGDSDNVVNRRVVQTQEHARHAQRASDPELHIQSPPSLSSESSSVCGSLKASGSDSAPGHSRNASSVSQQSASHFLYPAPADASTMTHSRHSSTESGQGGHHAPHFFMGRHRKSSDSVALLASGLHVPIPNKMSTSCGSVGSSSEFSGPAANRKNRFGPDSLGYRLDRTRIDNTVIVEDVLAVAVDGLSASDENEGLRLESVLK